MKASLRSTLVLPVAAAVCLSAWVPARGRGRRPKHAAPAPRSRAEVQAVLAKAKPPAGKEQRALNVLLLAGKKDHGPNEHDYPLWQKRWAVLLGGKSADAAGKGEVNCFYPQADRDKKQVLAGLPNVTVSTAWQWPTSKQFERADLVVMFSKPHWDAKSLKQASAFLDRGGGLVIMHMAIWQKSKPLADLVGLAAGKATTYRHGPVELDIAAADHPITLGLPKTIHLHDETYFHFQGDASKITVLATCDELVEKGKPEKRAEPIFWCCQRGKGRVYVCVLGHFMWTFDDPYFRLLVLRGMAWAAGESPYRFDALATRGVQFQEDSAKKP